MHTPMIFRDFSFISTVFIEFMNIQSIYLSQLTIRLDYYVKALL